MMNPDEFDALLHSSDPLADQADTANAETLLSQSRQQWSELSKRRRRARRQITFCLAATGLLAVVGGSTLWIGRGNDSSGRPVASVTLSEGPREVRAIEPGTESATLIPPETVNSIEPSDNGTNQSRRLNEFSMFVDSAGKNGSQTWLNARNYLAHQDARTQREAIYLVPRLSDQTRRTRAFDLVCEAAGNSQWAVLKTWANDRLLGELAWDRLAKHASLEQLAELIPLASQNFQRNLVCRKIASSPNSQSIEVLLNLARDPAWRTSVGSSASDLHPQHIQTLIMAMRHRSPALRTSAAFILASVPGDHVDRVVAEMIVNGRYRQPAYLVLLSRDTPQARAFLAQASLTPELNPALVSARMHFANIQQQLSQWITESRGTNHEPLNNTQSHLPEIIRGGRVVRLDGNRGELS